MSKEIYDDGLLPTSTLAERLQTIFESGISRRAISEVIHVSEASLRTYGKGGKPRTNRVWNAIDDIRFVMSLMVHEKGLNLSQTADLMQRRFVEPPQLSLLELTVNEPEKAIKLISGKIPANLYN